MLQRADDADTLLCVCVCRVVTDDSRLLEVPKLKGEKERARAAGMREAHARPCAVCALRFAKTARARIIKAGGEALTFDQVGVHARKRWSLGC